MKGVKTVYICSECSGQSMKWLGKCPSCGAWNSFVEDVIETAPQGAKSDARQARFSVVSGDGEVTISSAVAVSVNMASNSIIINSFFI